MSTKTAILKNVVTSPTTDSIFLKNVLFFLKLNIFQISLILLQFETLGYN